MLIPWTIAAPVAFVGSDSGLDLQLKPPLHRRDQMLLSLVLHGLGNRLMVAREIWKQCTWTAERQTSVADLFWPTRALGCEANERAMTDGADRSVVVLLELMPYGTDADHLFADFERRYESGAAERDDQFALLVVHGASGLAAGVR
jgi:hypothetical protein